MKIYRCACHRRLIFIRGSRQILETILQRIRSIGLNSEHREDYFHSVQRRGEPPSLSQVMEKVSNS